MSDMPSAKARDQMGRQPTQSTETKCKYCYGVDHKTPQGLKHHVFESHWFTTRREMYQNEEEYEEFMKGIVT